MKPYKRVGALTWGVRAFSEYLYPALCVGCRAEAPIGRTTAEYVMKKDPDGVLRQCFCARCYSDFAASRSVLCPDCGKPYSECECAPRALSDAGVERAYCCFAYEKGRRSSASSRFIYALKGAENRDCVNFAAHLLAERIKSAVGDVDGAILTFAPRSREAVLKNGADHMKLTAKFVSRLLGCEFADVFVNRSRGEQKLRGAGGRLESAGMMRLRRGADVSGRDVIVIDDILTSGATLGSCASLLYDAGASRVSVFALAKVPKRRVGGSNGGTL